MQIATFTKNLGIRPTISIVGSTTLLYTLQIVGSVKVAALVIAKVVHGAK